MKTGFSFTGLLFLTGAVLFAQDFSSDTESETSETKYTIPILAFQQVKAGSQYLRSSAGGVQYVHLTDDGTALPDGITASFIYMLDNFSHSILQKDSA